MDEQLIEKKIIKAKRKKKIGIYLICWPVIIFLLWIIVSMIFWYINKYVGSSEQTLLIKKFVNWVLGLLLLLYVFILPVGIILVVDANGDLRRLDKNNPVN